jgi:predicted ATP-dependent endonuclease of OLD family
LSERSNGLKWYLNLFIDILSCNLLGKNTVFLFDEPGTSLHVNAQRELLNLFNHLTASGNQVIYTTHSPYMLDTENDGIHRIRAVIKNECEDTVIYKTAYDVRIAPESQSDTLTPIVRALGMSLLTTFGPAKGKLNIVTEGMSDYIYMCLMAKVLNVDLSKCNFIPAQGATNSVNIVKILHGWGCKYIALFDFDKEGVEEGGEQIRNFFNSNIGDNFLYIIDVTQDDVDRQVYKDKTKSKVIEDLITKNEIDNFCALHNVALPLGKPLIAKLLSNAVENGTYNLGDECINNFKELFKRLGL